MNRVTGAGYVGDFTTGRAVLIPFRTVDSVGQGAAWSGIAQCVKPGGASTEAGVTIASSLLGKTGLNLVTIDTAADPAFYGSDSDFVVILDGDPVDGVDVQGVVVGQFSIANRS